MMVQTDQQNKNHFETLELKLAALILAEIDGCTFEISQQGNSHKKNIKLIFPKQNQSDVDKLVCEFIDRRARVSVSKYNKSLNLLRDELKD